MIDSEENINRVLGSGIGNISANTVKNINTGWDWFNNNGEKDKQQVVIVGSSGSGNTCFYYSTMRAACEDAQTEEGLKQLMEDNGLPSRGYVSDLDTFANSCRRDASQWLQLQAEVNDLMPVLSEDEVERIDGVELYTRLGAIRYINCVDESLIVMGNHMLTDIISKHALNPNAVSYSSLLEGPYTVAQSIVRNLQKGDIKFLNESLESITPEQFPHIEDVRVHMRAREYNEVQNLCQDIITVSNIHTIKILSFLIVGDYVEGAKYCNDNGIVYKSTNNRLEQFRSLRSDSEQSLEESIASVYYVTPENLQNIAETYIIPKAKELFTPKESDYKFIRNAETRTEKFSKDVAQATSIFSSPDFLKDSIKYYQRNIISTLNLKDLTSEEVEAKLKSQGVASQYFEGAKNWFPEFDLAMFQQFTTTLLSDNFKTFLNRIAENKMSISSSGKYRTLREAWDSNTGVSGIMFDNEGNPREDFGRDILVIMTIILDYLNLLVMILD
jgi:hypothetical protein